MPPMHSPQQIPRKLRRQPQLTIPRYFAPLMTPYTTSILEFQPPLLRFPIRNARGPNLQMSQMNVLVMVTRNGMTRRATR